MEVGSEIWNSKDPTTLLVLMVGNNYPASQEAGGPGSTGVVAEVLALYSINPGEFSTAAIVEFWIAAVVESSIAVVEGPPVAVGESPAAVGAVLEAQVFAQGMETPPHQHQAFSAMV